ncbi:hypothetical protein ACGF13_02265 [Kitasatospora sp. NPDC048286]
MSRGPAETEDEWLNRLADESAAEGREGCVTLEEMAIMLDGDHD